MGVHTRTEQKEPIEGDWARELCHKLSLSSCSVFRSGRLAWETRPCSSEAFSLLPGPPNFLTLPLHPVFLLAVIPPALWHWRTLIFFRGIETCIIFLGGVTKVTKAFYFLSIENPRWLQIARCKKIFPADQSKRRVILKRSCSDFQWPNVQRLLILALLHQHSPWLECKLTSQHFRRFHVELHQLKYLQNVQADCS